MNGRSISGDIEIDDTKVEGALEAGTISGTVRLRRVTARSLALNSVSGNVVHRGRHGGAGRGAGHQRQHHVRAATCSRTAATSSPRTPGTSASPLPAATGFQIEATSFSGSINTDIPVTMSGRPARTARPRPARDGRRRRRLPRPHDLLGLDHHRQALAGRRGLRPTTCRCWVSRQSRRREAPRPRRKSSANRRQSPELSCRRAGTLVAQVLLQREPSNVDIIAQVVRNLGASAGSHTPKAATQSAGCRRVSL